MARRMVMNESTKWSSGRAEVRCSLIGPSLRGGKMPHAFRDNERVAADSDRDVVMPSGKRAALKVVQPEFPFQILIGPLGAPALFDDPHDRLLSHWPRERGH